MSDLAAIEEEAVGPAAPGSAPPPRPRGNGETISRMSGARKAAILLVNLGPDRAAEVFNHLREEEIENLSLEMAKTREISAQQSEAVFKEMAEMMLAFDYIAEGGVEFAREVLERSLGSARANEIMGRLSAVIE